MSESTRFALAMVAFVLMAALLAIGRSPPSSTWNPANGFLLRPQLAADAQPPIDPQPLPQATDRNTQASKDSDVWSGVAGALLGAVIGLAGGVAAAWLPKRWDDRRKKQALATALLNEIRHLESTLRFTYNWIQLSGGIEPFETSTYDLARAEV